MALLRRLDAGLGVLQHIDYVLGFLSWRCRSKSQAIIKLALAKYRAGPGHCYLLQAYALNIGDEGSGAERAEHTDALSASISQLG